MFCYQNSSAQSPPKLVDDTNPLLIAKCWEINQYGTLYWICDSLAPGILFTTLKPFTGLGSLDSMHTVESWVDPIIGLSHTQYQQYYRGIKVEGAEYREHYLENSVIITNGSVCEDMTDSEVPEVSEETALENALSHVDAELYAWEDDSTEYFLKNDSLVTDTTYYPKGELVWALVGDSICEANYKLAWKFFIYSVTPFGKFHIYIDAQTGEFLKERDLEETNIGDFNHFKYSTRHIDTREWNGKPRLWTRDGGFRIKTKDSNQDGLWGIGRLPSHDNNDWGNSHWAATACHWAATESWRMWVEKYGRNGPDGHGSELRIWANWKDKTAFSPDATSAPDHYDIKVGTMTIGEFTGLTAEIETIGHEYTHAIIFSKKKLSGDGESGALKESYCDIFGFMADRHFWGFTNWSVNEAYAESEQVRNFQSPFLGSHSACPYGGTYPWVYLGSNWNSVPGTCRNHINCSVQNHCFYLLANGGTGGDAANTTVSAIGIDKAAQIAEFALNNLVAGGTEYFENRELWVAAARELFGPCSFEVIQTCRAWRAVGIGNYCNCEGLAFPCWPDPLGVEEGIPNAGINNVIKESFNRIIVYPNPSSDKFYINIGELTESGRQSVKSIQLIDVNGKVITNIYLNGKDLIECSILDLPSGIYAVKIQSDKFIKTFRIIKE